MRVSKSVFWMQFPSPGDLWDIHQEHVADGMWASSKAAAARRDDQAGPNWRAAMDAAWRAALGGGGRDRAVDDKWKVDYERDHPAPRPIRRAAKIQIVLWPWIKRYEPVRPRSDGDLNSGEVITQIVKAQVTYYAGDDSDEGEARERLTLGEHLRNTRRRRSRTLGILFLAALLVQLFIYLAAQSLHARGAGPRLREWQLAPAPAPQPVWEPLPEVSFEPEPELEPEVEFIESTVRMMNGPTEIQYVVTITRTLSKSSGSEDFSMTTVRTR